MQRALSQLHSWKLDHRSEDIRGWPLRNANGTFLGHVSELVADTDSKAVSEAILDDGRRIPAHSIQIGDGELRLMETKTDLTASVKGNGKPKIEAAVARTSEKTAEKVSEKLPARATLAHGTPLDASAAEVADLVVPIVAEELDVAKRRIQTGGVRIDTSLVEAAFERELKLREEHITVERRNVDRMLTPAEATDRWRDGTFEVTAKSERPVVKKSARIVEEIHLKKEHTAYDEKIKDKVRKTEVDVTQLRGSAIEGRR